MTGSDYARKLDELDHLLNDPAVPMQPGLIWRLLGEIAKHEANVAGASAPVNAAPVVACKA